MNTGINLYQWERRTEWLLAAAAVVFLGVYSVLTILVSGTSDIVIDWQTLPFIGGATLVFSMFYRILFCLRRSYFLDVFLPSTPPGETCWPAIWAALRPLRASAGHRSESSSHYSVVPPS